MNALIVWALVAIAIFVALVLVRYCVIRERERMAKEARDRGLAEAVRIRSSIRRSAFAEAVIERRQELHARTYPALKPDDDGFGAVSMIGLAVALGASNESSASTDSGSTSSSFDSGFSGGGGDSGGGGASGDY